MLSRRPDRSFDPKPEAPPNGRHIELYFALGKACADIGEHAHAFRHWRKGNSFMRAQADYDETATLQLWCHTQRVFTKDLLERFAHAGDPSDTPIFIVGMPRSGATLVEQILASHPAVRGAGERLDLADAARTFLGRTAGDRFPEFARTISADGLRRFGGFYEWKLRALAPDAMRIMVKMPANFVGLIRMALPNARIVHVRRDPVDTCLSCFSTLFARGRPYSYDLAELGRHYAAYETLMAHWRCALPDGAMLEIRYEDIVGDFECQANRIMAYAGLDWDDRPAFHQTVRPVQTANLFQIRRSVYREAVGRSAPYRAMLRPLLDALPHLGRGDGALE